MDADASGTETLSSEQYAALADFRFRLRRFLAFSEAAAGRAGLPPQQHQALLTVAGHAGRIPATVGLLAEQLLIAPHSAAELVARMVEGGLLTKTRAAEDRRRSELALTPRAEALLTGLTAAHLEELHGLAPALAEALETATRRGRREDGARLATRSSDDRRCDLSALAPRRTRSPR